MGKGKPSEVTLRIRAMARVERLKDKLMLAKLRETARRSTYEGRVKDMEAELAELENGGLTDELSPVK